MVIPVHGRLELLEHQLEALANQDCDLPWETVVVDNQSPESPDAIAGRYRDRMHVSVVAAHRRAGSAYARNCGVARARGELILHCDADDVVGDGWLRSMTSALRRHELVAGALDAERLNETWVRASRHNSQSDGAQNHYAFLHHAATANLGITRELHDRIGGFNEEATNLIDTDYCWRAQMAGARLHFEPSAVVHYRYRDELPSIYRQARNYGRADAALHVDYREDGLEPLTAIDHAKGLARVMRSLPQMRRRSGRARLTWMFGFQIGRLHGRLRHRR